MSVASETPRKSRRNILVLLPLIVFAGLAALFFIRLGAGDASRIPSALIGKPAPETNLPPLPGLVRNDGEPVPGLSNATFQGHVTLVNVWASWCVPCADEVPFLDQLAKDKRVQLVGLNYKDPPTMRAASSAATAIPMPPPGRTRTAATASTGASTACRRPSSSAETAASPTSSSARSPPKI